MLVLVSLKQWFSTWHGGGMPLLQGSNIRNPEYHVFILQFITVANLNL